MINFYNYFNFFYFNKKNFFNFIVKIWFVPKNYNINFNIIILSVLLISTKIDIKNSFEFFFGLSVIKINTLISKKKKIKKAFVYFNEII